MKTRRLLFFLALGLGLMLAVLVGFGGNLSRVYADNYTVTNTNDSGAGSLRVAIENANANAGQDTIDITAVGTITLNHPKANSYDLAFMKDLDSAIETMRQNDAVKVVVMKSGLEKFFSAGADIKAFQENTTDGNMKMIRFAHQALRKIGEIPKVFIAAIEGHALGGGLEIALACDLRIAAESAFVTAAFGRIGLSGDYGGSWLLNRLVGPAVAKDLYFSSRRIGA